MAIFFTSMKNISEKNPIIQIAKPLLSIVCKIFHISNIEAVAEFSTRVT